MCEILKLIPWQTDVIQGISGSYDNNCQNLQNLLIRKIAFMMFLVISTRCLVSHCITVYYIIFSFIIIIIIIIAIITNYDCRNTAFNWWVSFAPEFQCCYFCESSCLFYLSFNFDFYVSKIIH